MAGELNTAGKVGWRTSSAPVQVLPCPAGRLGNAEKSSKQI